MSTASILRAIDQLPRRRRPERLAWHGRCVSLKLGYSPETRVGEPDRYPVKAIAETLGNEPGWHCPTCRTHNTFHVVADLRGMGAALLRAAWSATTHNRREHPRRARRLYGE